MESISVNQFRDNLKNYVEKAAANHEPLKVTRRAGDDFVVMSAEDWEREQETLYVLRNKSLMAQIEASIETHQQGKGYTPNAEKIDAIIGV